MRTYDLASLSPPVAHSAPQHTHTHTHTGGRGEGGKLCSKEKGLIVPPSSVMAEDGLFTLLNRAKLAGRRDVQGYSVFFDYANSNIDIKLKWQ